ncbi:penicillin-binding protein [Hoylesella oralis]|uniref:penicillin-binding protein n=1 Tax=Hoylesella oralis TaxID=28134 RepID=UPI0028E5A36C|nr:penicillin-binding protein [Hoylesella oralis]
MSKFDHKKIMPRYSAIAIMMTLIAAAVVVKAAYVMTAKRSYWLQVANRVKKDSVSVKPTRGNILSCDGQLMASSLPEFKMFMDFQALHNAENDSLWSTKIDSICLCLHQIFPDRSVSAFKSKLEEGHRKMSRHWAIWDKRVDYNTYTEVKKLPVFNLAPYKSGFHVEEYNARQRPYGSLAGRTVGEMFGAKDTARCGLELSYDSILRGKNGIVHRRKTLNKYLNIMDTPPIDGADIVTTIDVSMQDLAERSLLNELREINGNVGVAIVMEVSTGDVKAIVNMEKCLDGEYREIKNHAISDLLEPGSVFKTASIMVALDDGVVDTTYRVETGSGVWPMYGRDMKDHNWRRGGYGLLTLPQTLMYSSNVGISRIIDDHYRNDPERFVRGIYRTGLADNLRIPLVGSSPAHIRMPKKNARGQYVNWSKTALPWMSIGYETQVPPLSTLTFYNAIANNGRMMRPRFVKEVIKNGEVIMNFPPQVMRAHICKDKTVHEMQAILEHVVSQGLGKKAGSPSFKVAGKTGTAQISQGVGGYKIGQTNYLLSFAGFFPANAPRYSCIVCIQKSGLPASGGGMSGVVFHHIAEGIMAQDLKLDVKDARDSSSILVPEVKNGNILAADYVLNHLGINSNADWNGSYADGNPVWGRVERRNNKTLLLKRSKNYGSTYVPNVIGMGARDAVFMLESHKLKVRITGRGKVVKQSLEPGHRIIRGEKCQIILE